MGEDGGGWGRMRSFRGLLRGVDEDVEWSELMGYSGKVLSVNLNDE